MSTLLNVYFQPNPMQVAFKYIKQTCLTIICEIGIINTFNLQKKETDIQINNLLWGPCCHVFQNVVWNELLC